MGRVHCKWGLGTVARFLVACVVCGMALLLPYRVRVWYSEMVAWIVHAPVIVFGRIARLLLGKLGMTNPYREYSEF